MLPKLEEETETPSGMRHKRRRGEGRTALGVGAERRGVPLPQGRGEPAGQTGGVCGRG